MKNFMFLVACLFTAMGFAQTLDGTWKLMPAAGAMGVGPAMGDTSWWSNSDADVTGRACLFDDEYIFNADGSFQNVLGTDTWVEGWQGGADACGTPVAPHDGSASATWTHDTTNNTVTVTGTGAYMGLPKVYNGGELTDPANAPASITYDITELTDTSLTLDISIGSGYWRFKFTKDAATPMGPETAAPTPTVDEAGVVSIFSNAYTDVTSTWNPAWGQSTVLEDVQVDGDDTKKYSNFNFTGIEPSATIDLDAEMMTHFHVDVWSADFEEFKIKLVDFGPDGAWSGGDDTEHELIYATPAQGEWISYDIPLDDFTGMTNRTALAQIIFAGGPAGATVYVDNIYFYNDNLGVEDITANQGMVTLYPNPVQAGMNFYLKSDNEEVAQVSVFNMEGKLVKTVMNTDEISTQGLDKGVYILTIETVNGNIENEKLIVR